MDSKNNTTIPDYNFPVDPHPEILMTSRDMQEYEENVKRIRSMVQDNNMYINDLQAHDYVVLTTPNDYMYGQTNWESGVMPVKTQQVQNPAGIFSVDTNGYIGTIKRGFYDVHFCFQATSEAAKEAKTESVRVRLVDQDGTMIKQTASTKIQRTATEYYPSFYGCFENVELGPLGDENKKFYLTLYAAGDPDTYENDIGLTVSTLDPFKNYIAIEPNGICTKPASSIAKAHRDLFSGLSFKKGQEIRATRDSSGNAILKAESYNTNEVKVTTRE